MHKALFIDRDGILNEMVYDETHGLLDSPRRPEQVRLVPGAGRFLRNGRALGYRIIVVTNQPGIAKGTLTPAQLDAVNNRLQELAGQEGGAWDDLRYCPHHPESGPGSVPEYECVCECRKPKPGMLLAAAREHGIDMVRSWMIGDGLNDIQAGKAAGCRTILVTRLKTEQIERFLDLPNCVPDALAVDLAQALEVIRRMLPEDITP